MEFIETGLPQLLIIKPKVFTDSRGYFYESYLQEKLEERGINTNFIQDNQSKSVRNVLRGLHYQLEPYAQAKLVRVLQGEVLDIAVDLRRNSPTFGQWHSIVLSDENHYQFYIPRGFAHGFSVLSDTAIFSYKCDNSYHPEAERGLRFDDPDLGIDWKINLDHAIVSEKDLRLPNLKDADYNFRF